VLAVGTQTLSVTFTPTDTADYTVGTATVSLLVNPITQTVTVTPSGPTITAGQSVTLTASGGSNGYIWGGVASGSGATQTISCPNIGTYTATVVSPAGGSYAQSNTVNVLITVTAAPQTVSITPTNPSVQVGQSLTFTATGGFTPFVWGGQATGTGSMQSPTFNSLGVYTVWVYAQAQGNYAQSNTAVAQVTTTPIPQTVSIAASPGKTVYVGATVTFTASGGNTTYAWGGAASGAGPTQSVTFHTVGAYPVTVQAVQGGNYAQSNLATVTITVNSTVPSITNTSDTGSVGVQDNDVKDPNAIIPPSN
jgi:hypothetical protein